MLNPLPLLGILLQNFLNRREKNFDLHWFITVKFFQNCRAIMNIEKGSDFILVCVSTIEL